MSFSRQFNFLTDSEDPTYFYLLGYPLRLSPTESSVVHKLLESPSLSPEDLRQLPTKTISRQCLAVHVHAINEKASAISGRKLILSVEGSYLLSPRM
ncbi:MAG: hypothetical protein IJY47_01890 [Clostridia bacterium]|nr:hypothetical protein [Clostridia bacterium]